MKYTVLTQKCENLLKIRIHPFYLVIDTKTSEFEIFVTQYMFSLLR